MIYSYAPRRPFFFQNFFCENQKAYQKLLTVFLVPKRFFDSKTQLFDRFSELSTVKTQNYTRLINAVKDLKQHHHCTLTGNTMMRVKFRTVIVARISYRAESANSSAKSCKWKTIQVSNFLWKLSKARFETLNFSPIVCLSFLQFRIQWSFLRKLNKQ